MKYIVITKSLLIALLLVGLQSFSQSLTPLVIGTLHPNDSIVIYYDVTINAGAGSQISNQGTMTGTGINLVTDDPDTGLPGDPTITPLNVFPLPVNLMDLKAVIKGRSIEVAWNVVAESMMVKYEIEKSPNGRDFAKIGEVTALNRSTATPYSFLDHNPFIGANYYRLRLIDGSSSSKYTLTVRVDRDGTNTNVSIFPNPVTNRNITLQVNNLQKGTYNILFYNNAGQLAFQKMLSHDGGSATKNISLPQHLQKGLYTVQLKDDTTLLSQLMFVH